MKVFEWCFLVAMSVVLLIITFITKNIYLTVGTFLLVMYLNKHSASIPIPKCFRKHDIVSVRSKKVIKADVKK